jgi:Flp pilus assembly protein TadD
MYQERGDFGSARNILTSALLREPGAASTLCAIAKLELRTGSEARALDHAERCLRANPLYPDAWFIAGLAYEHVGNGFAAQHAFRRQLELVPGHEGAAQRLAAMRGP